MLVVYNAVRKKPANRWESFVALSHCSPALACLCDDRLRVLAKDRSCPMCKAELETVVITAHTEREFESFDTYGTFGGPDMKYNEVQCTALWP